MTQQAPAPRTREPATPADPTQPLVERFGDEVAPLGVLSGMPVVKVRPGALRAVAAFLKEEGFRLLLDVGGVDYLGRRPPAERFEVVYHLLDPDRLRRLRLKVALPEQEPRVPTVCDIWASAGWAEREVFDLFGIRFEGHPDLRRILLPDGWEGHPLRKDYPLRGPNRTPGAQALRSRFAPLAPAPGQPPSAGPAPGGVSRGG